MAKSNKYSSVYVAIGMIAVLTLLYFSLSRCSGWYPTPSTKWDCSNNMCIESDQGKFDTEDDCTSSDVKKSPSPPPPPPGKRKNFW